MKKRKILFVCMGNICRSPTAHGIFRDLVIKAGLEKRFFFDSAGTSSVDWHAGDPPDSRSISTAKQHGIDISDLMSRQLIPNDFNEYDDILLMDHKNLLDAKKICPNKSLESKLAFLLDYAPEIGFSDVPDPYYNDGFHEVYYMIEAACEAYLQTLLDNNS